MQQAIGSDFPKPSICPSSLPAISHLIVVHTGMTRLHVPGGWRDWHNQNPGPPKERTLQRNDLRSHRLSMAGAARFTYNGLGNVKGMNFAFCLIAA